jgi:hypothetical protein
MNLPHNTSENKITHSAVASWGGFIYQGLCAVSVVLDRLNRNIADDCFLNVEGYEDFAILDNGKNVLSFHQCKFYAREKDFTGEFMKMEDRRNYWILEKKCTEEAKLYFHCNFEQEYSCGVEKYEYEEGDSILTSEEVEEKVKKLIGEIVKANNYPGNSESKFMLINDLILNLIIRVDNQAKQKHDDVQQLSIQESIPFSVFVDILKSPQTEYSVDDAMRTVRYYMTLNMKNKIDVQDKLELSDERCRAVPNLFLDRINKMEISDFGSIIQRLCPDVNLKSSPDIINAGNKNIVDCLYNVITQVVHDIDFSQIHWTGIDKHESPAALGSAVVSKEHCYNIIGNRHNLPSELFRDYRWLVGDIKESISNMMDEISNIIRIEPINHNDITKSAKLGLLTIKDKNDGNYK